MERVYSIGSTASSSDDSASATTTTMQAGQHPQQSNPSTESSAIMTPSRTSISSDRDTFSLRPTFMQKFRPPVATKFMQQILQAHLQHKVYHADECQKLTKLIAEEVKAKLIELELGRYKYVVNVILGENLGEGARMDSRCYWDQESDGSAQAFFTNDSMWCAAVAYAVFYY
ncbi:Tctex1 domain-containing protein 2 [Mortierella polycephala]|uniref:Tctex1 domain-containing protein 2 n=1 Tax=Mortierella polycephala TaxID=41804 RepID=A0A9P6PS58_9FUNG|nr:Tctex1 domain-containing protein 2 [Mortierella polycephala]